MRSAEDVKALIRTAFTTALYPGDDQLRGSDQGDEPFLLESEFRGKSDWRSIDAEFLDQAPDGFGSALSFFSQAAFRFYLPAYLIADLDGRLELVDPVFHLTHSLSGTTRHVDVGLEAWTRRRMSAFTPAEVTAIIAYLEWKAGTTQVDSERTSIDQSLNHYWRPRTSS